MSSCWKVRLVTDGSVSRHLNRKSWPSFTLRLERGVTNTVEESAGSVREAAKEKDLSDLCQVVLTSMASSYVTFDIKVDPGAQVLQALAGVPTTVRTSVSGV